MSKPLETPKDCLVCQKDPRLCSKLHALETPSELDEIFSKSPIDKEIPEDIWSTIYATWTGLWTDGYGEWDEKQPSDIYPLSDLLSRKAEARLKAAIERLIADEVREAEERIKTEYGCKECLKPISTSYCHPECWKKLHAARQPHPTGKESN